MKLIKAMATIGGWTILSRIAGFVRDILTAAFLGAGAVADAFFVALKLPNFFRRALAEGAFSYAFIPLYTEARSKHGDEDAAKFAHETFAALLSFLLPFTLIVLFLMPWIIYGVAPGFRVDSVRYDLAVTLTRITFPYLAFMSLTALLGGILNAHDRFAPFAAAPVLFNITIILFLLGATDFMQTAGHAMAVGVFVAGIVQLLWMFYHCRKAQIPIVLVRPRLTGRVKRLLKLMAPGLFGAGVTQLNLFIDIILASFLPVGAVSYLYYADRLHQLPLGVVGAAIGTALIPMLAKAVAENNQKDSVSLFNRAMETGLILTVPAAAALFVIPDILISVLFERGAFDHIAATATAGALMAYVIGLPAYVAVKVMNAAYFARQNTLSPVKISVFITACNIALSLALIKPLGHVGIALATGLTGWLHVIILGYNLNRADLLIFDDRLRKNSFKILFATAGMVVALLAASPIIQIQFITDMSLFHQITGLCFIVGLGIFVYGGLLLATRAVTKADLKTLKKPKLKS